MAPTATLLPQHHSGRRTTCAPTCALPGGAIAGRLRTPLWIFDIERARVVWANAAGLDLWRADTLDELVARDLDIDMSAAVRARLEDYRRTFEVSERSFSEMWTLYPKGGPRTLRLLFTGHRLPDGRMAMLCEALAEIVDTPERLRSADAVLHTPVMITLYDRAGRALWFNPAAQAARIPTAGDFSAHFVDAGDHRTLAEALAREGTARLQARVHTAAGLRWHEISARRCHDSVGGEEAILVSETDVTAYKSAEARIRYLAEHDTLTGLPNRAHLVTAVAERLAAAARTGSQVAILFLDLDRFKTINDSLGHPVGDELLTRVAQRLVGALEPSDLVARLGGDEFLVCIDGDERRAVRVARRLLGALEAPLAVGGRELPVGASIGVSIFPADGEDLDTLMRHADLAMYSAKAQGAARWARFDATMKAEVENDLQLEADLRRALERGEFELYYQPRLEIGSDRIVGTEALLRWHHPTRGLVMPGTFIGFAERIGLIDRIGAHALRRAALQQRAWAKAGHDLSISVNLSAVQFRDGRLAAVVADIVEETGCDPRRMQLEITESILIGDDAATTEAVDALHALGFSIAIDDFGTGYSNLGTIQRHPIDTLKIDRSFVATLETRPALAELIIGLCGLLDMRIVAEGVETEEQLAWLAARNCHEYQGYLFCPAIPVDQFEQLLARQKELLAAPPRPGRSPLWDLVPLVRQDSDLDWATPGARAKVARLEIAGAVERFAKRSGG